MAGSGRKTPYRKNVTDDVLNGLPLPAPDRGEVVARVRNPRGGNLLELDLGDGHVGLGMLPTKFRKLVWVKRGDMVLVSGSTDDIETRGGNAGAVRHMVASAKSKGENLTRQVNRLREEMVEKTKSRKQAINGRRSKPKGVLQRIKRGREAGEAEEAMLREL